MNGPSSGRGFRPVRQLGLSRKRKSCGVTHQGDSPRMSEEVDHENDDGCRNVKAIKLTDGRVCDKSEVEDCPQSGQQTKTEKMKKLEELYSVWKAGCKNAVLHLISMLEERQGGPVNVRKLLKELRIWEVVSSHFKDDPDLEFFESDTNGDYMG